MSDVKRDIVDRLMDEHVAASRTEAAEEITALRARVAEVEAALERAHSLFEPRNGERWVTPDTIQYGHEWMEWLAADRPLVPIDDLRAVQDALATARRDALEEAIHLMPRYFGVWSSTGVHIGVWDDGATAAKVLEEYPQGVMRDLIDVKAIRALADEAET
jgi:hypothetical protein